MEIFPTVRVDAGRVTEDSEDVGHLGGSCRFKVWIG